VRRFITAVTALVLFLSSPSFAKFDPSFTWTTIETPHFLIHYHQGEEEIAKRAAVIAEDVHERLVPRIKWEPKQRTHIVLVDAMDESNGMTTPFPYNQMILFLTRPLGEPGFGTTVYDDWMRLLITHEYTHVLQLDMVHGVPKTLQGILGRVYFPNLFQPIWMIEGLAVYEETEQTSGGRGRSPGADMVLRMAALEGPFPSLGQAAVFPDFWPSGQVPYLFGGSFTRYIVERYGREMLADISKTYSGRGLPFFVDSTGRRVLYRSYDDLWFEWEVSLKERYRKQEQEVRSEGISTSQPLTKKGFSVVSPAYSIDGKHIAYAVSNADEFPGIYVMNADGSGDHKIVENTASSTSSGESIAWSSDSKGIYYTKIDIHRNTNLYNDIYYYDLKRDKEVPITSGLRARDPYPSSDGRKIIFVTNKLGKTRLAVLDVPSGPGASFKEEEVTWLTEASSYQYEMPRFSPDGTMVIVGVGQPGGYKDIWILDSRGNKIDELMHDRAVDGAATWSPDGKVIYFASDRTGVFNLYAYELASKKICQITNVVGGAFTPSPSPDGKELAFSSYSAKGYDIHKMSLDHASWKPVEPYVDRFPAITYEEKSVETSSRPYSPVSTIYPRFWLPWFGYSYESGTMVGALTFGQDAVQRHQYTASVFYGPKNGRVWYEIDYFYDGLYPTLHFHASDNDVTYANFLKDTQGERDYVERDRTFGVSLIVPLLKYASQHELTVGYRWKEVSQLTDLPPWPGYAGPLPVEGYLASGRLFYQYNNAKRYDFSISPEEGRTIALGTERFDQSLGSDFDFTKYTADWHEYVNLPWKHHVLLARAFAGTSTGLAPPQGAYQLGGDNPGDITLTLNDQTVTLRGYPANVLRGRKAALGSLEYRFPVSLLERGWDTKPVYYRKFHGAVFFEAGNAWDGTFHKADVRRSVGAEARLDMTLAYYLPLTIRFVVAKGLDNEGEWQAYLGLWVPLEL